MLCGCIDIGTNTTRVLVAEARDGRLTEVLQRRAFTRLGRGLAPGGAIPAARIAENAGSWPSSVALAEQAGAQSDPRGRHGGASASPPTATSSAAPCASTAASRCACSTGEEEARLAFLGRDADARASRCRDASAVVDVGGGSTEIAIGTVDGGVDWWRSFAFGSGFLADALPGRRPAVARDELDEVRYARRARCSPASRRRRSTSRSRSVAARPRCGGSSATSSTDQSLERALRVLTSESGGGRRGALSTWTPQRVRLMPAGLLALEAAAHGCSASRCGSRAAVYARAYCSTWPGM